MKTTLLFIRHGQVHNPDYIFYGRLPRFRLSETGRQQARFAGRALNGAPVAAIFSSPMLRARQTAREIFRYHPHLTVRISKLLSEISTPFEGRPADEVDRRYGDVYSGIDSRYEQPADIVKRVQKFMQRVCRQYAGKQIAAVTHGDVIAFAVMWAHRHQLLPSHKSRLIAFGIPDGYPAPASITTFTFRTTVNVEMPTVAYLRPY